MATTHTTRQEDTMASCPTIDGHRCLDCAPAARPFTTDGLHTGNPLQLRQPQPPAPAAAPAPFTEHWQGVTTPRVNGVHDIDGPNHDHFVVIPDPAKPHAKPKTAASKKRAASQARKALAARIPVILPKGA